MVFPLWFEHGEHVVPVFAFPRGFLDYPFQPVQDCQTYKDYLSALPMLYGVIHHLVPTMTAADVDPAKAAAFQEVRSALCNRSLRFCLIEHVLTGS
jgi:hypothetical protein